MPKLNLAFSHRLSEEDALKRVRNLLGELKTQFTDKIGDIHEEWDGNCSRFCFSVKGFSISGTLTVKPSEVKLSGNLPFAAMFFKGKIESAIRERAETLLA